MKNEEEILDLLLKGAEKGLSPEEVKTLKAALNVDEIEDYTEVIRTFLSEQEAIEPSIKTKQAVLEQFNNRNQNKPKLVPLYIKLLKVAAVVIFLVGIATVLNNNDQENLKLETAEETDMLQEMEFESLAEQDKKEENEEMKEETRYLLHVDFFSNAGLLGR